MSSILIKNKLFSNSLWLTIGFTLVSLTVTMLAGVLVALLLNRNFVGRNFMRTLILVPWLLPTVVVGNMWAWILNANYGVLNAIAKSLGLISSYQNWLGSGLSAFLSLVFVKCWREIPFVALMYLAGFQTISPDLYEVARLEGLSKFQTFFRITLPLIKPVSLVVIIMETMWTFRIFDIVYVMTGGGPANQTMVVAYYTYLENFKYYHLGTGSAMAYIITIFIMLVSILYIRIVNTTDNE